MVRLQQEISGSVMPGSQMFVSLCSLTVLSTFASRAIAAAAPGTTPDSSVSSMLPDGKNGTALLDQLLKNAGALGDYKYDATLESYAGKKVLRATGTFYFKPVNSVRMEVKDFGCKSGSILVRGSDGKIKGKGGPQMWGMKMNLGADSRLLKMPNGLNAVESDVVSLYRRLKAEAAGGNKVVSGNGPMKVDSLSSPALVLESQSGSKVMDRVFIDPVKKLPVQWDLFDDGKFQSRSKFQNYQINAHWDDSQFSI
jgi:outer membrane lipoprotein-sorting protein